MLVFFNVLYIMKQVKVAIGANYGEEGKGLMTRYFCLNSKNPVVIFYQGSSNRGATINKKDNIELQLMHLGTGILDNVPTYFSKYFMINPTDLRFELCDLTRMFMNDYPIVYADKDCYIITPVDRKLDEIRKTY